MSYGHASLGFHDDDQGLSSSALTSFLVPPHHLQHSLYPSLSHMDSLKAHANSKKDIDLTPASSDSLTQVLQNRTGTTGFGITEQRATPSDAVVPTFSRHYGKRFPGMFSSPHMDRQRLQEDAGLGLGLGLSMNSSASEDSFRSLLLDPSQDGAGHMGAQSAALCYSPLPSVGPHGGVLYGAAGLPFQATMMPSVPPPFLVNPTTQAGPSPGALARQQRATVDLQRGKRKRPATESAQTGLKAAKGSGVAGGDGAEGGSPSLGQQEVPASMRVPPPSSVGLVTPSVTRVKEERRRKRLLRNRVSAQQARERKRQHMTELESRCAKMEEDNEHLEDQIEDLTRENEQLRHLVKENMRASAGVIGHGT